jgi:mono/diheme cytochrome c family protein
MMMKLTTKHHIAALLALLSLSGLAQAGDPVRGRGLYEEHCAGCHGMAGLPQVPSVPNFSTGQGLMKPDQEIMAYIKRGGTVMPGFKGILSDSEISDVIAHMRTFF